MKKIYKHYIGVINYTNMEGKERPLYIVWNEGIKYKIEKIYRVQEESSIAGGCGLMYDCKIQGKRVNLYKQQSRWFIECSLPPVEFWMGC
ncbi:MAG: hypothetical protein PHH04_01800 [Thomasclavelia sp.]|nr:hypothetical protein [Thomasclavelia sp.]